MTKIRSGTWYILAASLLFSLGGVLIKLIPWSPLSINSARCFLAAIVIGVYMIVRKHRLRFHRQVWLGAFCMACTVTLFTAATKLTTAANAIVLQYTAPIFVMLFLWAFFRRRPGRADLFACFFVLAGIVCCFAENLSTGRITGDIAAVLAGMAYAGVCMLNVSPKSDALSSILLGQLLAIPIGIPSLIQETNYEIQPVLCLLALGILQVGVAYLFFSEGLRSTPPVTVSIICGIEPVLNPLWVSLFYGEQLGGLAVIGAIIVFLSVFVYNISAQKKGSAISAETREDDCGPV